MDHYSYVVGIGKCMCHVVSDWYQKGLVCNMINGPIGNKKIPIVPLNTKYSKKLHLNIFKNYRLFTYDFYLDHKNSVRVFKKYE